VSRRPVVLIAHDVDERGGMEHALTELVRRLAEDHDVTVVSRALAPELRGLVTWRRVRVIPRPFVLTFVSFAVAGTVATLRAGRGVRVAAGAIVLCRVDVSLVHFCHAAYRRVAATLGRTQGSPLQRAYNAVRRRLAYGLERRSFRPGRVRTLVAVSEGLGRELRELYPGPAVVVAPNGVEPHAVAAAERARVRAEVGTAETAIVALFVGGDWPRKGLDVAVEAVGAARADVELWVAGTGDAERFRDAAGRVRFLGRRDDVDRLLAAADLFVFPTRYETFSLVVHEAAAAGLPVIATRVHGVADLLAGDAAGRLVERSAGAVAAALDELAGDPELRARLGAEGRRRVAALTWDAQAQTIARAIDDVAATVLPR
jgi:glycosyltransferase involved in cell wall biosynthesis